MNQMAGSFLSWSVCLALWLFWAAALPAQKPYFVAISPQKVTLLIGDSTSFRLVDQNGHRQSHVAWHVSDPDAFQVYDGDEFTITAKEAGDYRVDARTADGSAEATVKVMEGYAMPVGTVKWSAGATPGCKSIKIIPAVPTANGPDIFEQSQCDDGQYIAAYIAGGVQMWRRKMTSTGAFPAAAYANDPVSAARLNTRSASVCVSVVLGTDGQKIRDLLQERKLSFSEGAPGEREWIVEESTTQCKLWFDDKSVLTKKRKIFVTE